MSATQDLDEILQAQDQSAPIILLVGPSRSGKTSIQRVVFGKLSPHETQFLEQTQQPCGIHYPSNNPEAVREALLRCRIIDLPGASTFFKQYSQQLIQRLLAAAACIVYVIDASNDQTWPEATQCLIELLTRMEQNDIQRPVSILLHKTDLEQNYIGDMRTQYTDLRRNLLDALRTNSIRLPLAFHVTSLFDITIFECFSRIFQQIIPQTNLICTLLDGFITACGIEKAYLVDTQSKLYIATDSTTPDVALYQLLCDMVDLSFDIGLVYTPHQDDDDDDGDDDDDNTNSNNENDGLGNDLEKKKEKKESKKATENDFFDCYTAETVLHNGVHLSLRQLNNHLSVLYSLRPDSRFVTSRKGTIEYNITCLKQALSQIFNISLFGIQNRSVNLNFSQQSPPTSSDFGIHHYMGSYASTSALSNLKSIYQNVGSMVPGSMYTSGSLINSSNGMLMNSGNNTSPTGRQQSSRNQSTTQPNHSYTQ